MFVVFHAPWCGHCKALMPTWNLVTEQVESDDSHVAMTSIDCTTQESLCTKYKIQGFPSIMHGSSHDLEPYEGGRDEESLLAFARNMKPICGIHNKEHCDDEDAKALDDFATLDVEALQARVENYEANIVDVEAGYKAEVEGLQEEYSNITRIKKEKLESLRTESHIRLLKDVLRAKNKNDS